MATNAVKSSVFGSMSKRSYFQKLNPIYGQVNVIKQCVLPNKLVVVSADNGSPLTRLSVVFRAGSRYETAENHGAAHVLRIAAGLSNKCSSHFAIVRNIQQVGATLTCTTDRETIAYTLEGTYDTVERSSAFLSDVACSQVFKPWEIADSMPRLKLELSSLSPQVRAINFLHRVAFRNGLGNSLFCAKHNVGKLSTETLLHYVASNFTTNRAAVVGLGIDQEQLVKYAQNMCLGSGSAADVKSKYYGGEVRSEKGGELAYVAIGTEGGSLRNEKLALAFDILQYAYGVGPKTTHGVENGGIFAKACGSDAPIAVSAINASYSDTGLFGVLIAGPANNIRNSVLTVANALRSGNVSDADINRGKNQLKTAMLLASESGSKFIDVMGTQAVITGSVRTPEEICRAIDDISNADIANAAKNVSSQKLSIASVGNLSNVPYLDELK